MQQRPILLFGWIILITISCSNTTSPDNSDWADQIITQQESENILSTLSDDAMMGRRAFSEGSRKAADYIADKFEEFGLKPLDSQSGYLQEFSRYVLQHTNSSLQINGETIDPDSFFVDSNYESLDWNNLSSYNTIVISPDDPLGNAFGTGENTIALVDPSHKERFEEYARGLGRRSVTLDPNEGHSIVFVRTSITSVNSGELSYTASIEKQDGQNVVGQIPGTNESNEEIIFGAHYDHVGYLEPVNGDSIANGANDNASGTTALIMLGKYFKELEAPGRTITFAAFTAEESGMHGSKYFSQQIDPNQVTTMINLEMLGKPIQAGPNSAYLTGFEKSDLGDILQSNLENTPYDIIKHPRPEERHYFRSDNIQFASLGIPAHTVSTAETSTDEHYHTVDDEINTLDLQNFTNLIKAIAIGSETVVDGNDTPTQTDSN